MNNDSVPKMVFQQTGPERRIIHAKLYEYLLAQTKNE
jgi:hypothetical protein